MLPFTWMFSNIALFGGHSNWYSWPSPSMCIFTHWKQSTFSQLWCRRAHDKQLSIQQTSNVLYSQRPYFFFSGRIISFPSNTWYYSLLPTAKVIPFPNLELTHVPICNTMQVLAEIRCQWCWPNNMKINNVSTIYSFLLQ